MARLVVNAGSTSMKVSLVEHGRRIRRFDSLDDALTGDEPFDAIVHRVVHGGDRSTAVRIDDEVRDELERLTGLAPLHQPEALSAIDRCRAACPHVDHFAVFDTAFHTTIPAEARAYALPARLREVVKVYGFHGISYAWSTRRLAERAPQCRRVVIAHLGGGQSLCGVLDGRSVTTTMGFTPLDGLVMATRPGSLDPGAVLWLGEHTDEDLATVFDRESGLFGLCGTADMAEVLRRCAAGDAAASFAIEVWLHRLVALIGGSVATLGGLDALVFTGGIGENSPAARSLVADRLSCFGVAIDGAIETSGDREEITAPGGAVRTFVIEASEDLEMDLQLTPSDRG